MNRDDRLTLYVHGVSLSLSFIYKDLLCYRKYCLKFLLFVNPEAFFFSLYPIRCGYVGRLVILRPRSVILAPRARPQGASRRRVEFYSLCRLGEKIINSAARPWTKAPEAASFKNLSEIKESRSSGEGLLMHRSF